MIITERDLERGREEAKAKAGDAWERLVRPYINEEVDELTLNIHLDIKVKLAPKSLKGES